MPGKAAELIGFVRDSQTNELLVGATIYIKELKTGTTTGLDGSYKIKNLKKGTYKIVCSYISYNSEENEINITDENKVLNLDFKLSIATVQINGINVTAHKDLSTEISARTSERQSANLLNVVSAKTIELSPDVDVASVVQRMSGITLDKSFR